MYVVLMLVNGDKVIFVVLRLLRMSFFLIDCDKSGQMGKRGCNLSYIAGNQ